MLIYNFLTKNLSYFKSSMIFLQNFMLLISPQNHLATITSLHIFNLSHKVNCHLVQT